MCGNNGLAYPRVFALAAADVAVLAAAATPVLLVLLHGALFFLQAKVVERLAAHLAVNHLERTGEGKKG